jgi:hypothetical protein
MGKRLLWLRIAYWAGIIADALVAALMVFPRLYVRFYAIDVVPDAAFGLGLRRAAPLMAGWTVLLLWADRKPVERKVVLPMTACPVVVGYATYVVYATVAGFISLGQMVSSLVVEVLFAALFTVGYLNARAIESDVLAGRRCCSGQTVNL